MAKEDTPDTDKPSSEETLRVVRKHPEDPKVQPKPRSILSVLMDAENGGCCGEEPPAKVGSLKAAAPASAPNQAGAAVKKDPGTPSP